MEQPAENIPNEIPQNESAPIDSPPQEDYSYLSPASGDPAKPSRKIRKFSRKAAKILLLVLVVVLIVVLLGKFVFDFMQSRQPEETLTIPEQAAVELTEQFPFDDLHGVKSKKTVENDDGSTTEVLEIWGELRFVQDGLALVHYPNSGEDIEILFNPDDDPVVFTGYRYNPPDNGQQTKITSVIYTWIGEIVVFKVEVQPNGSYKAIMMTVPEKEDDRDYQNVINSESYQDSLEATSSTESSDIFPL